VKDKLHRLTFADSTMKEIVIDIFGVRKDVFKLGLLDCYDEDKFRKQLECLKESWDAVKNKHRLSRRWIQSFINGLLMKNRI
jgi:hypothetical protein